ncbi:MAG: hypothetical protein ACTHNW_11235 [Mucilaginibacter sp.]
MKPLINGLPSTRMTVVMMLIIIICASNCKKQKDPAPTPTPTPTSTDSTIKISMIGLRSDSGYAYKIGYDLDVAGDSQQGPQQSTLRLFENGVELIPAHSNHEDIRKYGLGQFSHWGNILYFSTSDNSNPLKNGRKYSYTLKPGPALSLTPKLADGTIKINLIGLKSDSGYCYKIGYDLTALGDSQTSPQASTLILFENGVQLGPAHSNHKSIREYGLGQYSHWGNTLYFSTSDNSNPLTNGRVYSYSMK